MLMTDAKQQQLGCGGGREKTQTDKQKSNPRYCGVEGNKQGLEGGVG